jgi:acetolactate synthase-1/2/3 large subunit
MTGGLMHGFQAIPELLRQSGATTVFGVLGNSNVTWIGAGVRSGALRLVKTRHEETAVSAAAAFSRVTGGLGVCGATRGPGFANSINPLISAVHYHAPLLLIVGESPASGEPTSQDIDQRAFTATIGAGFHHAARVEELEASFWEAIEAVRFNGLPQVLSIGDGILEAEVNLASAAPERQAPVVPPADRIAAAVDALDGSRRPLILAGQGALLADCRADLERLAELTGARLGTTINVNRFFAGHPHELGLVGQSAPAMTKELMRDADVVLGVGASLNGFTLDRGRLFGGATMIQCEIDGNCEQRASRPDLVLVGDARATVRAIIDEWLERGLADRPIDGPPPPAFDVLAEAILAPDIGHDPKRGIDLRRLYHDISQRLPADRIVLTDAGRSRATMAALVNARDARSWLDSRGYGSVGLGLGFAIGAATAAPGRRVVLFTGDVGFMMSSHDLDAMRLNGLDLTIIIRNDQQFGAELKYLAAAGLPPDIARQDLPDVPALARALGGDGVVIQDLSELRDEHLDRPGLFVVDARIDPDVDWRTALDQAQLEA